MINQPEKITSIKGLIEALNAKKPNTPYLNIMRSIDIDIPSFEEFFTWNEEHYTRNCLSKTDDYELVLICWEKGQKSVIHDYDACEAWIHPIMGKLREEKFIINPATSQLEKVSSLILGTNEFSFISHHPEIHRYSNVYEARSVSLHLYSKPVHEWNVYDETTSEKSRLKVGYDQIVVL